MTPTRNHRAPRRGPEKPLHRFQVGQVVRMNSRTGLARDTAELFHVTGHLPVGRNSSPQYRIRNDGELHERVAIEDSIALVADETASASPNQKTGEQHGQGPKTQQPRAPQAEAGKGSGGT